MLKQFFKKGWVIIFAVVIIFSTFNISNVGAVQTKPPTTTSWYVYVTSNETDQDLRNWMYSKGYEAGQKDLSLPGKQYSLAILDFGQPWLSGTTQGIWSFNKDYGRFLSASVIKEAVKWFAWGYYNGTGSDYDSQIRIAVGTNNYGPNVGYWHGQSWATMIKDIGVWLASNYIGSQVQARGASDIESDYSSPSTAYSWVDGYNSMWVPPYYLYNYGSANGCPTSGTTNISKSCPTPKSTAQGWTWTQDNYQYVSWGADPSYPLPEIYNTTGANAKQWQQISLYSYLAKGGRMAFLGPLSQSQACVQRGGCYGFNNTPDQAWTQLWNEINSDSRTWQNLSYSTDIKWRK